MEDEHVNYNEEKESDEEDSVWNEGHESIQSDQSSDNEYKYSGGTIKEDKIWNDD